MKQLIVHYTFKYLFLLSVGLAISITLPAQTRTTWHPLFGKNLADAVYAPGSWMQKGNIIHAGPEEWIWSMEEYQHFELDLEFNNTPLATSSVILNCPDRNQWDDQAIRILLAAPQTNDDDDEIGLPVCGSIYGQELVVRDGVVKKPGEWNHLRIRLAGGRLSVILNGRKITEWDTQTAVPAYPMKGFIGLEGGREEYPVTFRNIRIRELTENEFRSSASSSSTPRRERDRTFPTY